MNSGLLNREQQVIKKDEVPLTFDIPEYSTVEKRGSSRVSILSTVNEKSSFTSSRLSGKEPETTTMVIFKRRTLAGVREAAPLSVEKY